MDTKLQNGPPTLKSLPCGLLDASAEQEKRVLKLHVPWQFWKPPQIKVLFWDVCVVKMTETWFVTRMKYLNVFPHLFKDAIKLLKWLDFKGHSILQLNFKINYIIFYCLQYSNKHFYVLVCNLINLTQLNVLLLVISYLVYFCYMRRGYKRGMQTWSGKTQKAGTWVL